MAKESQGNIYDKRVSPVLLHLSQVGRFPRVVPQQVVLADGEGGHALAGLGDVVGGAARRRVHEGGAAVQVNEHLEMKQNAMQTSTDLYCPHVHEEMLPLISLGLGK